MNRLWVRVSLVIATVAIFIAVFPLLSRQLGWRVPPPGGIGRPSLTELEETEIPPERLERIEERVREQVWWWLWGTVAMGATIGLIAGILLSRGLVRPLTELEQGAHELATRNLAYRVPEAGSVETRTVARAFNDMASELEQQETLRRNMLADVTHELRHPIHVLRGNLQGILDGVFPLETSEIATLLEETQHLSQLVNDLHDLALAEAHELPLHVQELPLNDLIQDAVDAVYPLAREKEIALTLNLPEKECVSRLDRGRMRQAVQNLLSNGIRYTTEGGNISVTLACTTKESQITVTDTGIGIAAEDVPYVFDRFYRSDTSRNRDQGGAGLGLAIVKAIVEAHNGRVTIHSPGFNQGSTFTIYLPNIHDIQAASQA